MNEPIRTQWQIRCAFNGFCKLSLRREAMNAHRDTKQRQLREVTFSDLSPEEENQLFVCDEYFADDEAEQSFVVGGKEITAKLLAEARRATPLFDIRRACSRPSVGFPSRPWETRWTEIVFGIIGGQFLCTVTQYFGGSRDASSSCSGLDPAAPPRRWRPPPPQRSLLPPRRSRPPAQWSRYHSPHWLPCHR